MWADLGGGQGSDTGAGVPVCLGSGADSPFDWDGPRGHQCPLQGHLLQVFLLHLLPGLQGLGAGVLQQAEPRGPVATITGSSSPSSGTCPLGSGLFMDIN